MMDKGGSNGKRTPRTMSQGGWYWIQKALMKDHAVDIRPMGIAVYNCLASMTDRNQECFPSQQYIASTLGFSRQTISKALKVLEQRGLIAITENGRDGHVYRLLEMRCKDSDAQMLTQGNSDVKQSYTNNTMVIKPNNNIVGVDKFDLSLSEFSKTVVLKTKEELLAIDIAAGLEDSSHLPRYRTLAHRYPEHFLRKILSEVKQVPDHRIRKSRVALFHHLLKKYVQENNYDPGDQPRN